MHNLKMVIKKIVFKQYAKIHFTDYLDFFLRESYRAGKQRFFQCILVQNSAWNIFLSKLIECFSKNSVCSLQDSSYWPFKNISDDIIQCDVPKDLSSVFILILNWQRNFSNTAKVLNNILLVDKTNFFVMIEVWNFSVRLQISNLT